RFTGEADSRGLADQPPLSGPGGNVSLRLAVAPAWPAEPVGVAQPATRRMQARTPLVLVACTRLRRDDDLGLAQSVEDLAIEQLIAEASVEALDVAVLPKPAPLDVGGLGADSRDPFLHGLGDELRSVVGPDVSGNTPQDEEIGQDVDHIDRLELAGDTDRQAFMAELVGAVRIPSTRPANKSCAAISMCSRH